MVGSLDKKLVGLGIELPSAPGPAGAYVTCRRSDNLLYVSGQLSISNVGEVRGRLGNDLDVEQGQAAAMICGLNLLAQARAYCGGDLDSIAGCIQLTGYVNATPEFTGHPTVLNGASELMVLLFGDRGRHTRVAIGASSLPLGVAVEVSGIFELEE